MSQRSKTVKLEKSHRKKFILKSLVHNQASFVGLPHHHEAPLRGSTSKIKLNFYYACGITPQLEAGAHLRGLLTGQWTIQLRKNVAAVGTGERLESRTKVLRPIFNRPHIFQSLEESSRRTDELAKKLMQAEEEAKSVKREMKKRSQNKNQHIQRSAVSSGSARCYDNKVVLC